MNNTVRRGGLGQQLARSFDSAVRLLRGLTSHEPTTPSASKGAGPSSAASGERLRRLLLARQQLEQHVAKLEQELERLHATITSSGRGDVGTADAPGRSLNAAMESARQLRERLQAKRLELVRMDRNIARERQLLGHSAKTAATDEEPPRRSTTATTPAASRPRAKSPRVMLAQRAVAAALRQAPLDRGERALVTSIAEGLLSNDEEVRRQAVTRLGERPRPVVPLLLLAIDDPAEGVRRAARGARAGLRHPAVTKVFRRFLHDPSSPLRLAALRGLASADDPNLTSGDLVGTLGDADAAVRRAAADVLGWHREGAKMSSGAIRALAFALYDEDVAVRVAAAEALGTAGDDRAVLALMRAVGDPAEVVREAALRAVRSLVGAEVDGIVERAAPEKRAEALKVWWRTARVQLRSGSLATSPTEIGSTARDVLRTLASLKDTAAAGASPVTRLGVSPAATAEAPREKAPQPAPAAAAPASTKAEPPPVEAPPAAAPAPAEFESVFQEGGEGSEGEESEEYESILDEKPQL